MGKDYRQYSKTSKTPRRPYEKERLDRELRLVGEYGLRNKKEIWRVQYTLSKVRSVARYLLTLNPKDPQRIFDGDALLRRLTRYGVLGENEQKLDYVLSLNAEKFLDRRLQTRVLHSNLANSIHHSRVLINQRHIRVGKRLVNIPSFLVRLDSEKNISFTLTSPLGGGPPGRVKKRSIKKAAAASASSSGASEETDEAI